jgi:predicted amidohydrolase
MTSLLDARPNGLSQARKENDDIALATFTRLAAELQVSLLIGSLAIKLDTETCVNRSYLINPQGLIQSRYDKIHLFDVALGAGNAFHESRSYQAGDQAFVCDVDGVGVGLSICYDLRFPHLYRQLAQQGAQILAVPAAFTRITGEAHWHTLLRARAIETGSFVIAPAQCGKHIDGRETYGHSLIVNPWGAIVAECEDGPGFIIADLDISEVKSARQRIPSLIHEPAFTVYGLR